MWANGAKIMKTALVVVEKGFRMKRKKKRGGNLLFFQGKANINFDLLTETTFCHLESRLDVFDAMTGGQRVSIRGDHQSFAFSTFSFFIHNLVRLHLSHIHDMVMNSLTKPKSRLKKKNIPDNLARFFKLHRESSIKNVHASFQVSTILHFDCARGAHSNSSKHVSVSGLR